MNAVGSAIRDAAIVRPVNRVQSGWEAGRPAGLILYDSVA
jgi:hypothetical protein